MKAGRVRLKAWLQCPARKRRGTGATLVFAAISAALMASAQGLRAAALGAEAGGVPGDGCGLEHAKAVTEDATPVEKGRLEIEFAAGGEMAERSWDGDGRLFSSGRNSELEVEAGVKYGFAEGLDGGISLGFANLRETGGDPDAGSGLTDLCMGIKWRFYASEAAKIELAYVPGLTMPTGDVTNPDGLGAGRGYWSTTQLLALSWDFGARWTASADLGYDLPFGENGKGAPDALAADAGVGFHVLDWLQPEIEMNYAAEYAEGDGASRMLGVTAGFHAMFGGRYRLTAAVLGAVAGRTAERPLGGVVKLVSCW